MSIIKNKFPIASIVFAEILLLAIASAAQSIEAVIKISSPTTLEIKGRLIDESTDRAGRNWSFRQSIAGVENLGARVSEFSLSDKESRSVAFVKLADGEYLAEDRADVYSYQTNLKPESNVAALAHASWLADDRGILMLKDLLPQNVAGRQTISARLTFDLPADWKIISSEKNAGEHSFTIENVETAIFAVGKSWRTEKIPAGKTVLNLAISGEWQFSDREAAAMAKEIYAEYENFFGRSPSEKTQIFLTRAAPPVKFGRWAAETRGATATIASGDAAFKTQSLQLLHEQLRHELFHLWMPNDLALTGNYDWFYEGFTVYQALRTGVKMNQIGFENFLETLAQAYRLDSFQNVTLSLVESSKNRWNTPNASVYARGLLTAFLCDITLLRASRGKRSISEIFREVYRKHQIPNKSEDGNAAILKILKHHSELDSIIEKHISGTEKINWKNDLDAIGIEATTDASFVRLRVKAKLDRKQKNLLNELGYNNWRKLSGKRK